MSWSAAKLPFAFTHGADNLRAVSMGTQATSLQIIRIISGLPCA